MFLRYFKTFIVKYKWYFFSGASALAVTDVLDVIPPLIIMRGVDQITSRAPSAELLKTALIFGGATVLLAVVRFHWRMQFGKFHQNIANDLREMVFNKLTYLTPSFYTENQTGELMSLLSNDVEAVRMGMGPGLVVLTDALFYFLTIPPIMFHLSRSLTFKSLALLPILPFFVRWLGKIIHKRFLVEQEKFSELSGIVQENISGIRTVKTYVQEKNQGKYFDRASFDLKTASEKVAFTETFMHPVMEFCVTVGVVILIFFGTDDVIRGTITVGTFVAFQRYISKMVWPMTAIGWGFALVSQATASLKRLDDLLNIIPEVKHAEPEENSCSSPTLPFVLKDFSVHVRELNFKFPGSSVLALKNVSFDIFPGEKVGLVGSVGSGKTALIQLLAHLYQVERGQIFFGTQDINDIPLGTLRNTVTLIPQDPFLFSTSVRENIAYGSIGTINFELEEIKQVARLANIHLEIESLPSTYDTLLGERGVNLSGGQKQRLTIARGLLRKSPIFIFDDSLSAVDADTEKKILRNIFDPDAGVDIARSIIIVSHKISSLNLCDKIIALENGKLEAVGTPTEMRVKSQVYRELIRLQNQAENDGLKHGGEII